MSVDRDEPSKPRPAGAPPSAGWETTVTTLTERWTAWQEALQARGHAEHVDTRVQVAAAVRELLQVLGLDAGGSSWARALEAILVLLEDPQASLPESLGTALVLTHERQADLGLRQLLAERDPAWAESVLAARDSLPASPTEASAGSLSAPAGAAAPQAQPSRDWWSVPVEGLMGSNQLFLLETRELLRSAELSLQALERDPGDYAEQMVLCRSFQAVAVAAESMRLHRLALLAGEGEREFDRLLEEGGTAHADILRSTDCRLQQLYAELLDLVGEPAPSGPPQVLAQQDLVAGSAPAPPPPSPPPSRSAAPVEPKPAPWWWAVDWSAWPSDPHAHPASAPEGIPPPADAAGLRKAWGSTSPSDAPVRLSTLELRQWVETLWMEGHIEDARVRLIERLQEAACVPVESWSVALFRAARREARERGSTVDFDIEGGQVRLEAACLQRVMSAMEAAIAGRVAQGTGGALRLRAFRRHGGVRLTLGDGLDIPWAPSIDSSMRELGNWLTAQGGDLRCTGLEWTIDLPMTPMQWPVSAVAVGAAVLWLPALWIVGVSPLTSEIRARVLQEGSVSHDGQHCPVADLGALIRAEGAAESACQLVLLQRGDEHLGLVVDSVANVEWVRPLAWPEALAALRSRAGVWNLAQRRGGAPCAVTDPFALHHRFGAAARVLERSRARRRP